MKDPAPGREAGKPDIPIPIPSKEADLKPLDETYLDEQSDVDAKTFIDSLRHDNVPDYKILAGIADIHELSFSIKQGRIAVNCRNNADENARRMEVVYAVDAVREALGMAGWPMDAMGANPDQWKDLCAFEAVVFLACPEALVEVTCSLARAKLRNMFGTRTLCGWVDTALLCTAGPVMTTKYIATEQFLVSVARSHVDIQDTPAIIAGARNVSLSFAHGIILSRMFMFVEQLLLSNAHTLNFRREHRSANKSGVVACAEIERDGRLAYAWCCMLFNLIYQKDMPDGLGDYETRYPLLFTPGASNNPTAEYIKKTYHEAKTTWFSYTQLLPTALYLVQENVVQKYNDAGSYEAFTGLSTSIRSCMDMESAKQRFEFSRTFMPLRIAYAKTQFVTSVVAHAVSSMMGTAATYSPQIVQIALLASSSAATTMTNAPVTTAFVGTVGATQALNAMREANPDMAQYVEGVFGNATAAAIGATAQAAVAAAEGAVKLTVKYGPDVARAGVRVGAGFTAGAAASAATVLLNTEPLAAASAQAGINVTNAIPSASESAGAAMRGVEGREGAAATTVAGTAIGMTVGMKYAYRTMKRTFVNLARGGITKAKNRAGIIVGAMGTIPVPVRRLYGGRTTIGRVERGIMN